MVPFVDLINRLAMMPSDARKSPVSDHVFEPVSSILPSDSFKQVEETKVVPVLITPIALRDDIKPETPVIVNYFSTANGHCTSVTLTSES